MVNFYLKRKSITTAKAYFYEKLLTCSNALNFRITFGQETNNPNLKS